MVCLRRNRQKGHFINRAVGKVSLNDLKLELKIGKSIVSNHTEVAEKLNSHFTSNVEENVKQKNNIGNYNNSQHKVNHFPNSIFVHRVTEGEVKSLTKGLVDKHSADMMMYLNVLLNTVFSCSKPLKHMYNVSFNSVVFPNEWKTAKVKPLYKKGAMYGIQNCRPISVLSVFSILLKGLMFNRWILFFFYLIIGY